MRTDGLRGGGLRRKGAWVQPPGPGARQVQCGREPHFPFSATGQRHVALPSPVSAYVVPATEGTQPLPERALVAPLKVHYPASHAFLYKRLNLCLCYSFMFISFLLFQLRGREGHQNCRM